MQNTVIQFKNVTKYLGGNKILEDVSFDISHGEVVGIIGPNGAGKTTILRTLLGLLNPDQGNVYVLNNKVNHHMKKQNFKIGFVMDKHGFYKNKKGINNLYDFASLYGVGDKEIKERLTKYANILEINDNLDQKIKTYSKGMIQKLVILRSLVHNPEILILDEPTSGLDPSMQVQIRNMIKDLSRVEHKTILFSSHHLDEVSKICDRIIIISHGKIRYNGKLNELLIGQDIRIEYVADKTIDVETIRSINSLDDVISIESNENRVICSVKTRDCFANIYNILLLNNISVNSFNTLNNSLENLYLNISKEEV